MGVSICLNHRQLSKTENHFKNIQTHLQKLGEICRGRESPTRSRGDSKGTLPASSLSGRPPAITPADSPSTVSCATTSSVPTTPSTKKRSRDYRKSSKMKDSSEFRARCCVRLRRFTCRESSG